MCYILWEKRPKLSFPYLDRTANKMMGHFFTQLDIFWKSWFFILLTGLYKTFFALKHSINSKTSSLYSKFSKKHPICVQKKSPPSWFGGFWTRKKQCNPHFFSYQCCPLWPRALLGFSLAKQTFQFKKKNFWPILLNSYWLICYSWT